MDAITHFLIDYGYRGMFLSAFLAGSVSPFSSEAVMLGLLAATTHLWQHRKRHGRYGQLWVRTIGKARMA